MHPPQFNDFHGYKPLAGFNAVIAACALPGLWDTALWLLHHMGIARTMGRHNG
jgi:hypothetical protein